ncbi:MAG: sugar phosphate isomerase/epimerase [Lachnospiraceae bacterium]|nr:sugar phosphate isomerase/epimerase [Lachnospiraceae bacterium]
MKLGTSSPLSHKTPQEWADKHKSLGLSAVNFHLTCEDDEREIDEYVRCAGSAGLTIAEVGIWRNTLDPDEDKRKEAVRYAIGQLELADRIGARCCVNILGSRGPRWDGAYKDNYSEETYKMGIKTIREIIDAVNPVNTFFTIEPMPWMLPDGPDEYQKLLEAVDRDRFAVHMDVFNWMTSARRYFYNEEFIDECFSKLGSLVKSCHLKDVKMEDDYTVFFRETHPGDGGVSIAHLIKTALSYDADMTFIVEHLDTDEEYIRSVRYVQGLWEGLQKKG